MQNKKIRIRHDWRRIHSEEADLNTVDHPVLIRILFDMFLIHTFEHTLLSLKKDDCVWGPVHTSIGQEAVAAATMAALRPGDKISGSHRAHHQFLSKVLHYAIPPDWDPLSGKLPEAGHEVVRRTLAEIMGLSEGYCGGRGGSMHLRYLDAGVLGTNAIVAGGVPLSVGAAYTEKFRKTGNLVVAFFGDGGVNQGSFHEAANLAGLWKLPAIFYIENNEYAVSTPVDSACAVEDPSLRAIAYDMDARIVEGNDVLGLYMAAREAVDSIRNGGKPVMIEAKCYRHLHHAGDLAGSAFGYRDKSEEEEYLSKDAVANFPGQLVSAGVLGESDVGSIQKLVDEVVGSAVDRCTEGDSPRRVRPHLWPKPETAGLGARSDGSELGDLHYSEIKDFSDLTELKYVDAIARVTGRWLERDAEAVVIGEDIATLSGGPYGATRGLPARFPDRVLGTPISEAGFVGLTCGIAMSGMRPVVEIMFPDFSLVAADQLFNQIAKARHMYGGTTDLPLVARTRIATGCGYGGQHSMDPVGLYALFVGWRIVAPSNAFDYIGLFNTAMHSRDPVLILEHHTLYQTKSPVPDGNMDYCIPFGRAKIVQQGSDVTVATYGSMVGRTKQLKSEFENRGISVEIVDLRTVDPPAIDYETLGASLRKTGAMAIVEEAAGGQSIGARIAHAVTERYFDFLDGPVGSVTSLDVPNSVSRVLEEAAMLGDDEILETVTAIAKRQWK